MSENCTHDCSTCSANCSSREGGIPKEAPNALSHIKKVIGVVSGKGGVGKSLVSALLADGMKKRGKNAAVMDADITGPSIPRIFGIRGRAEGCEDGLFPAQSRGGVKIMSIDLLLEDPKDPVVWRGPVIAGVVKQFWTEVIWGDVDYMFVDMPPGTGDVPLTVFQSLPVDGILVVASPQDLVAQVVGKAVRMAGLMNVPILGVVENMSYVLCPDCGRKIYPFGESRTRTLCETYGLPLLAEIPMDPSIAKACDEGTLESLNASFLEGALDRVGTL
ncbi:MAG: Mrp/NBP35 family ATP-binding protein [Clostridia bacterium]|nr:Mrp/NBP35 family ATP-binding protein [Clostridia bacterium]